MTNLFLAERWCRVRDSVSALNCQLASLASQNGLKRTCCVVMKATEQEKKDASSCGVELILPCLSEELVDTYGNDDPEPKWLLSPETYFTTLMDLQDVEYIVEHVQASTRLLVAHVLRKRRFCDANIVVINHAVPSKQLQNTHLKFAESATAVFSIGPTVFEEYKNLYERTGIKVKHELYLPRPENGFFDLKVSENVTSLKQILTVITGVDVESKSNEVIAAAVGQTAETFRRMHVKIPKWFVRTKSKADPNDTRVFLTNNLKCSCLEPTTYPPHGSQDDPYSDLRESNVLVIPPDEPFSVEALQAIAAGLPVLVPRRTATAEFLLYNFADKAEYFLYNPIVDDLSEQINKMLNKRATTELALKLKQKYRGHKEVTETHENFRSCFAGPHHAELCQVTSQTSLACSGQSESTDDGVGSFEGSHSNQSPSPLTVSHASPLFENGNQTEKSKTAGNLERKRPLMPTLQCDANLEIEEQKTKVETPPTIEQLRQEFELQKLKDQQKIQQEKKEMQLKAIWQAYDNEVESIKMGAAPDMAEKLDKAYEKFSARLEKIDVGSLRSLLSFLSEEDINYFWQKYEEGDLDKTLSGILVTPEMQSLAEEAGYTVRIRSRVDKKEYEIVKEILHNISAIHAIPGRTLVRTIVHGRWERYILRHVDENQARYLIEQSRYHPVVSEFRSDEFFFPAFVSFWYEHCYTLPSTLTEATEHAIRHHVDMYCKEHRIQIENCWHVVQSRLSDIGKQVFDKFKDTKTFSQELDVPYTKAYLFGLLKDNDQSVIGFPVDKRHESKKTFFSQHVYFYCLAVYFTATNNEYLLKEFFIQMVNGLPSVLHYVAGILKNKSTVFFTTLRNCLVNTFPRTLEKLALLGRTLIEIKCPSKFRGIVQRFLTSFQTLDLSVTDLTNISSQTLEALAFIVSNIDHIKNVVLVSEKQKQFLSEQFQERLVGLLKNETSFVHVKVENTVELEVISRYIVFHRLLVSSKDCQGGHSECYITSIKIEAVQDNFSLCDKKVTKILVNALASLPFLKSLHMNGFKGRFLTDMLETMIQNNVVLKVRLLELSQNNLDYTFTKVMLKALRCLPLLKQLGIGRNRLCSLGCIRLLPLYGEIDVILENNWIEPCLKTILECEKCFGQLKYCMQEITQINTLQDIKKIQKSMNDIIDADLSNTSGTIVKTFCHTLACASNLKHLYLSNGNITKAVAIVLADSFEHLLSLNYIDISSNNIGDEGIIYIGSKIHILKYLRYANFHNTQISVRGTVFLLHIVQEEQQQYINVSKNMKGLSHILPFIKKQLPNYHHELELDANDLPLSKLYFLNDISNIATFCFNDMQMTHTDFENLCQGLSNLYSLREISLKNNNINYSSVEFLCSAIVTMAQIRNFDPTYIVEDNDSVNLSKAMTNIPGLTHIYLGHNNIGDAGADSLSKVMAIVPHVIHIDLSYNDIGDVGVDSLGKGMKNLTRFEQLDLSHNNIGDVGAKSLSKGMENKTSLRRLDLSHNNIGDVGAESLSQQMENKTELECLDLSHNNIGDVGAESLSKGIDNMTNLERIDLSYNNIGDVGAKSLSERTENMIRLAYLDLSHNSIGDVGAQCLNNMMADMSRLIHINLGHNDIRDIGADFLNREINNLKKKKTHLDLKYKNLGDFSAVTLSKCMKNLILLKDLDLSHNNIGDVGAASLSEGIENMNLLERLDVSHNNISDDGTESLSKGISNKTGLKRLNLSHNHIDDMGAKSLSKGMENITWMQRLDLSHNSIGDVGAESLSKGIENMIRLQRLDLSHNNIGDVGIKKFGEGMKKMPELIILNLSHNNIGDVGPEGLSKGMENLTRLELLDLSHNRIGDVGIKKFSKSMKNLPELKQFDISHNNIGDVGIEKFCKGIKKMPELMNLNLSHNKIGDVGLKRFSEGMKKMSEMVILNLSHNNICDVGAERLSKGIKNLTRLERVDLSQNNIGDVGIKKFCKGIKKMQALINLNLSHNNIGDYGIKKFSKVMKKVPALKHLDVSHNNIEDVGATSLGNGFENMIQLEHLDLSHNKIGDVGAKSLSARTKNMCQLAYLDLSYNSVGDVGAQNLNNMIVDAPQPIRIDLSHNNIQDNGAEFLSREMKKMRKKKAHLDLTYKNIGDFSAVTLSKFIKTMTWLKYLDLSHNNIGDVGAVSLSEGIENITGLERVVLSHNNIGDVGAVSVSKALAKIPQLNFANLSHNNIGDASAESLSKLMENGACLEFLDLSHNNIGEVCAKILSKRIENIRGRKHVTLVIDSHHNIYMPKHLENESNVDSGSEIHEISNISLTSNVCSEGEIHGTLEMYDSPVMSKQISISSDQCSHAGSKYLRRGHRSHTSVGIGHRSHSYERIGHTYSSSGSHQGIDSNTDISHSRHSYVGSGHSSHSYAGISHSFTGSGHSSYILAGRGRSSYSLAGSHQGIDSTGIGHSRHSYVGSGHISHSFAGISHSFTGSGHSSYILAGSGHSSNSLAGSHQGIDSNTGIGHSRHSYAGISHSSHSFTGSGHSSYSFTGSDHSSYSLAGSGCSSYSSAGGEE